MGNIFISYRREDSAGHTGRLFDRLREHFGKDRVFIDIAGIEPGVDFVEAIEKAVGSCDAFVVVIGKQWLNVTDADGRRRLDNPEDFIRLELASALRRNIRIIPVLVQGAAAPGGKNLPEDLKKLSRLQAHEITDNRWDYDVGKLIEILEKVLKKEMTQDSGGKEEAISKPFKFPRWAIAGIAAILIGIGVYAIRPPVQPSISVPNVIGEPFEEAKAMLIEKGLEISREEKQTDEKPPGTVIDQKPKPGTEVKRGQRVDLVLAVRSIIKMPDVVGKRIEEARALLEKTGLRIAAVQERVTAEKPTGIVLAQNPKPDALVPRGENIELVIARLPQIKQEPKTKQESSVEDLSRTQYSLPGDSVIHFRVVEHQGLKLTIEVDYNYNERHGNKVMAGAWLKPSELVSGYAPTFVPHPGKGAVRVPISVGKPGVSTEIEVFLYEWGRPAEAFARRNFPYKMRFE